MLPDLEALYRHLARHMAGTIKANNEAGKPTSFILPVGPTRQDPELARIVNEERMFFPDPRCPERTDQAFDRYGPADTCHAGVGHHGHVALHEGIVSLRDDPPLRGHDRNDGHHGLRAHRSAFYCGHWQRTVYRRTPFQEPTVGYPATLLKRHRSFAIRIDAVTAGPRRRSPTDGRMGTGRAERNGDGNGDGNR